MIEGIKQLRPHVSVGVTDSIGKDEEVIIRKKHTSLRAPFSAVGALSNSRHRRKSMREHMDIFDLLDQVSKGAISIFRKLKFERNEKINVAFYDTSALTKTQKETFSRNLRELKVVDLVRVLPKVVNSLVPNMVYNYGKHTYIINPEMLRCFNHDEAEYLWNRCDSLKDGKSVLGVKEVTNEAIA